MLISVFLWFCCCSLSLSFSCASVARFYQLPGFALATSGSTCVAGPRILVSLSSYSPPSPSHTPASFASLSPSAPILSSASSRLPSAAATNRPSPVPASSSLVSASAFSSSSFLDCFGDAARKTNRSDQYLLFAFRHAPTEYIGCFEEGNPHALMPIPMMTGGRGGASSSSPSSSFGSLPDSFSSCYAQVISMQAQV